MENREKIAKQIAIISVLSNIVLTVGKLVIGVVATSEALFADGVHSAADVFASVIVLLVINYANQPADKEHPYGHGRAEVVVSGLVGILLFLVSAYIIYEAIIGLFHPFESPQMIAVWVALFSYVAKLILYRFSLNIGKKYNSKAIEAIAYDHKADIIASLAAAFGIFLSIMGDKFNLKLLLYGDKIASIFVAYLIFKIAKKMLVEAFNILIDINVDQAVLDQISQLILSFPEVKRIDSIRGREHGHYILLDLRIAILYSKTIKEGHDLTKQIKKKILDEYNEVEQIIIHINPYFPE